MSKAKKAQKKAFPPSPASRDTSKPSLLEQLNHPGAAAAFLGVVFLFLLWLYKPIVFDGMDVEGSDLISGIGDTRQIKLYQQETGQQPLWNPFMFCGMPIYHRLNGASWSFDTLLNQLDALIDWRVWYLWLGAIGMFLLIRYLKLHALTAMLASLAFILIPHFHALIVVGHFSKLRALMWMPWALLTFLYFLEKRNWLSMLLFTVVFALLLRTQHYQIIFYATMLLFFAGVAPYLKMALEKRWPDFLKVSGMFIAAIILVTLIVAQPLFVTRDYTPYSTRGGQAVTLNEEISEKDKKGVGFDYATGWSYTIAEFWNLVVPKFHGGTSQELYTGNAVPQFRNRVIPTYWGELPFTQSYEYIGVLVAFLALLGIFFQWKRAIVKSLTLLTLLALLLSLGKNFSPLYKLFFYYVPYFDKFRVPMMILTLVSFNAAVLAAIGLDHLFREGLSRKADLQKFLGVGIFFAVLLLIPLLFGSSFSLAQANEAQRYAVQYGPEQAQQIVEMLRQARLDILTASTGRTLIIFLLGGALLFFIGWQPGKLSYLGLGIILLLVIDLASVSHSYLSDKFVDLDNIEARTYRETEIDRLIKQDDSLYRVLPPLRVVASDSRWTYHYQSIGGYNPAKMQTIQDIITNNLIDPANPQMPVNLNVVSMLNGKYIAAEQRYQDPRLEYLGSDAGQNLHLFRNLEVLPRAFFVDSVRVIAGGVERLEFMNSPAFDPRTAALLEEPLSEAVEAPDSSVAEVTLFTPDKLVVQAYTDRPALLVLSEVYYPNGWKATLENGQELKIYKTNHILRSMVVPAGQHAITLEFHPATYYTGIQLSWAGWIITYLGLAGLIYRSRREAFAQYGKGIREWFSRKKSAENK